MSILRRNGSKGGGVGVKINGRATKPTRGARRRIKKLTRLTEPLREEMSERH